MKEDRIVLNGKGEERARGSRGCEGKKKKITIVVMSVGQAASCVKVKHRSVLINQSLR
jgi:hypothetical protein